MIEISNSYDRNKESLNRFLSTVNYSKFNLWPNITSQATTNFLINELNEKSKLGKLFIVKQNQQVLGLLLFVNLEWDTIHFGFSSGKIEFLFIDENLDNDTIQESLTLMLSSFQKFCNSSNVIFVSLSVNSWQKKIINHLQKFNFRYVLTWIDGFLPSEINFPITDDGVKVSLIRKEEINFFQELSSKHYFKGGRFHFDDNFEKEKVNGMYHNLVQASYENQDVLLVARVKEEPVGLFICKKIVPNRNLNNIKIAALRYLIVDPQYRKMKIGHNLFIKTIQILGKESDLITTGLEAHNLASLNLHLKLGFIFNNTHCAFHWWNK